MNSPQQKIKKKRNPRKIPIDRDYIISIYIYTLKNRTIPHKECFNCKTSHTPLWRYFKKLPLCNACGIIIHRFMRN